MNESWTYVSDETETKTRESVTQKRDKVGVAIETMPGHNFPVLSLNSHSRCRRTFKLQAGG